jgi:hypothetical protein
MVVIYDTCVETMAGDVAVHDIDIFVNCGCVATRWQQYSTHLHTNSTQNNTVNKFGWKAFWDSNPGCSN